MKGLNRKLVVGIAAILFLFVPLFVGTIYSLRQAVATQNRLVITHAEELILARDLFRLMVEQNAALPVYALSGDQALIKEFDRANTEFGQTLSRLDQMALDPKSHELLARIRETQKQIQALAQPGVERMRRRQGLEAANAYFRQTAAPQSRLLAESIQEFIAFTTAAYEREKAQNNQTSRRIFKILGLASTLIVFFCLAISALLLQLLRQKRIFDQANERLLQKEMQLSTARKETLEIVAHDLKNPLASILLATQTALRRAQKSQEHAAASIGGMENVLRSAETMRRLISDLLDHAKIESGSLRLDRRPCKVSPLLQGITARFAPMAKSKGIRLECECPPNLPPIYADEGRLEQLLSNLVGNAIKFTPEHGLIQLQCRAQDASLLFLVSDTGSGMTAEQLEHAFERYWQARETERQGTGLGLAIAKAIAQAHGGSIWATSEPGGGTTFVVSLPLVESIAPTLSHGAIPANHGDKMDNEPASI